MPVPDHVSAPDILDETMTRGDVVFVLENLSFARNGLAAVRLDRPVRDFIVDALRRNGPARHVLVDRRSELRIVMMVELNRARLATAKAERVVARRQDHRGRPRADHGVRAADARGISDMRDG